MSDPEHESRGAMPVMCRSIERIEVKQWSHASGREGTPSWGMEGGVNRVLLAAWTTPYLTPKTNIHVNEIRRIDACATRSIAVARRVFPNKSPTTPSEKEAASPPLNTEPTARQLAGQLSTVQLYLVEQAVPMAKAAPNSRKATTAAAAGDAHRRRFGLTTEAMLLQASSPSLGRDLCHRISSLPPCDGRSGRPDRHPSEFRRSGPGSPLGNGAASRTGSTLGRAVRDPGRDGSCRSHSVLSDA